MKPCPRLARIEFVAVLALAVTGRASVGEVFLTNIAVNFASFVGGDLNDGGRGAAVSAIVTTSMDCRRRRTRLAADPHRSGADATSPECGPTWSVRRTHRQRESGRAPSPVPRVKAARVPSPVAAADRDRSPAGVPAVVGLGPVAEEVTMSNSPVEEVQTLAPEPEPAAAPTMSDRQLLAHEIVKKHVAYAAVVGLVPLPLVNAAGVAGIEIKLLHDLAEIYGVPFRQDRVKSIVTSLIGGVLSTELGVVTAGAVKGWSILGGVLAFVCVPTFAGAVTYAVGRVFIQHFESGGTFLDFDPEKVQHYFKAQFQRGKTATA
jgi:uncharacterized protein (DUF697 family)